MSTSGRYVNQATRRSPRAADHAGPPGYISKVFRRSIGELRLKHIRIRPYRPQTNGKAERFIQTLLREWAYERPYKTSAHRNQRLRTWLRHYNEIRPHGSLAGRPPVSRLELAA